MTRAFDEEGALDVWMIDPAWIREGIDTLTALSAATSARYVVRGYVNRLEHPADPRRLVVDSLTSRCRLRPQGTSQGQRLPIHHAIRQCKGDQLLGN